MNEPQEKSSTTSSSPVQVQSSSTTYLISSEKLSHLYKMMVELRAISCKSRNGACPPKTQVYEACEIGCTVDLRRDDVLAVLPEQRVGELVRGLSSLHGTRANGQGESDAYKQDLSRKVIRHSNGERLAIATGVAFAFRSERKDTVVIAFGRAEEFRTQDEMLSFAYRGRLPIIYVQLPGRTARQSSAKKPRNRDDRIPIVPVDQDDVVAVYRIAYEAIDKARRGAGPTVIACVPYRLGLTARPQDSSPCGDPILYMEHYLRKKNLWSDDLKSRR